MNTSFIKLNSIIITILLLIGVGEWLTAYLAKQEMNSTLQIKHQDYQADEMPTIDLTENSEESYTDLVDRPLFVQGRKPVEETSPANTPAQVLNATANNNFDWQLVGVYTKDKKLTAMFNHFKVKLPKAKDNYRKLTVGEILDGWELTEIKLDRVLLKQAGNSKELLLYKPKPKTVPNNNPADATPTPPTDAEAVPPAESVPEEQVAPEEPTEPQGDFENPNANF